MPRFLVIRFSSIGDIVLTSPVMRCLKQQVPDAEVHYLTKTAFAPVVQHNPYIDKVWRLEDENLIPELKAVTWDALIDLHHNLRSKKFTGMLDAPAHRFHKLNIEKWLMVNLKVNHLPDLHIVDRYLQTVSYLGVQNDGRGLDYFTGETEAVALPQNFADGYMALVIGAAHATKIIPVSKAVEIIHGLNRPVILLGGKEDISRGEQIAAACGGFPVWNAAGKFPLNTSAALVRDAALVITGDTGLMHIAAAFKKKIISIWGNTIPAFGMTPYLPQTLRNHSVIIENKNVRCRPCSKLGFEKCPKGHFKCMMDMDVAAILQAAEGLIEK